MTAQISDTFLFNGESYVLLGLTGSSLVSPEQFGMDPEMLHTACYRGFYASYTFSDNTLYLSELTLRERNGNYLPIGNVQPETTEYDATYRNLQEPIPFTGNLQLGKDFIDELYIHMGYQPATSYRTVINLTLEAGKIIAVEKT